MTAIPEIPRIDRTPDDQKRAPRGTEPERLWRTVVGELLRDASESYDLVVLDSPPVLSGADTEGLASHPGVDVVLVTRKTTKRRAVRRAMRRLELIEAHVERSNSSLANAASAGPCILGLTM